jgi:hypothetical protein
MLSSCAHHVPHYTAQALSARGKRLVVLPHSFGLSAIVAWWTWCATSTASVAAASTGIRYVRTTVIILKKNEASGERRPQRTLRSLDCQRASRKPSAHAVTLCSPCANHVPHFTAHARLVEAAAYKLFARSPSQVFETRPRAKEGRGVRYACTNINAHHVS